MPVKGVYQLVKSDDLGVRYAFTAGYTSSSVVVGALEGDQALFPLGCKRFLGRATDFICTKKLGFDACENLRKQGKPIICRLARDAAK